MGGLRAPTSRTEPHKATAMGSRKKKQGDKGPGGKPPVIKKAARVAKAAKRAAPVHRDEEGPHEVRRLIMIVAESFPLAVNEAIVGSNI